MSCGERSGSKAADTFKAEQRQNVRDNESVSASARASLTAGPLGGAAVKVTADSQTLSDGSVSVSGRTNTGNFSANAGATVDVTIGPKSVSSDVTASASVRARVVGVTVNVGDEGANVVISVGPQIGVTATVPPPQPTSGGVGGATRVDVGGAAQSVGQSLVNGARSAIQAISAASSECAATAGCS